MNKQNILDLLDKVMPIDTTQRRIFDTYFNSLQRWTKYLITYQTKKKEFDANLEKVFLPLYFPKLEHPNVSIVIPVYNNFVYTYTCLKSILEKTKGVQYQVIVVDNASTDDTTSLADLAINISVIRNTENLGFVEACNIGARQAKGKYILFLNNDTKVTENWLSPMVNTIENDRTVGLIGAKLIYPDGKLQEAGGIVWNNENYMAWNFGKFKNPDNYEYNYIKEVDYCSGACLLVRKDLFYRAGSFDMRYSPAYCEDTDLAFSIRQLGYKVIYQPKSEIIHFEGKTAGTNTSFGIKKYQVRNQKKFYRRWRAVLKKEHFDVGVNVFLARDRSQKKKVLLFVDHHVPTYDKDAGSLSAYLYLKLFIEMDFKIIFIPNNLDKLEPYTSELQNLGVEVVYSPFKFKQWLRKNGKYLDYVLLSRPLISKKYIKAIRDHSQARILYYMHDLHYLRVLRRYEITKKQSILKQAHRWKELENYIFKKVDTVLTVSDKEIKYINNSNVILIPLFFYEKIPAEVEQVAPYHKRSNILFLGGFDHLPNVDAVQYFIKKIFPSIKKKLSKVKLYVVGSNPSESIKKFAGEDIFITGYVKDLNQYFQNALVFVAPLRYGSGLKGKIVTSMSYGVPVVTSTIGNEGLNLVDRYHCMVADTPEKFTQSVIEIYQNQELWEKLSSNSIQFVKDRFSKNNAKDCILKALGDIG